MKKILFSEGKLNLTKENLPMLIHGEDHAGASFYTINLISHLFNQGEEIIVQCGYPMAEEQFKKEVDNYEDKVVFYTKEKVTDFEKALVSSENKIILLKNIELFDKKIINQVIKKEKYILSGDFNKSILGGTFPLEPFKTKIFFSEFSGVAMPPLNKFEGFLIAEDAKGITKLEI